MLASVVRASAAGRANCPPNPTDEKNTASASAANEEISFFVCFSQRNTG